MILKIAERAGEINTRSLGNFFGPIQYAFFDTLVLNTCSIFEQSRKHKQYSVPAAVSYLRAYHLERREPFLEAMIGCRVAIGHAASNSDLVRIYTDEIDSE